MTTLIAFFACCAGMILQDQPAPPYSQTYAVFIRGNLAGTETAAERTDKDGNRIWTSQHQMQVSDGIEMKQLAFETTLVLAKDGKTPVSYQHKYLTGSKDYCSVTVKEGKITRVLSRGGNVNETSSILQPGTVILDVNVFYQYDVLVRLYDHLTKGRQLFHNFIPVVGSDVQLAVTFLEESKLEYGKGAIEVRNYKVEFFGSRVGAFSTDLNGRLVRVILREQELEVVRKDLVPGDSESTSAASAPSASRGRLDGR